MLSNWGPFTYVTPLSLGLFKSEIRRKKEEVCFTPWFCPMVVTTLFYTSGFSLPHLVPQGGPWGMCICTNTAQRVVRPTPTVVCSGHCLFCLSVLDSQFLASGFYSILSSFYFSTRINYPLLFSLGCLYFIYACSSSAVWK